MPDESRNHVARLEYGYGTLLKKKDTMSFYLACEEMKEENLEALHPNITGLDVCHVFE